MDGSLRGVVWLRRKRGHERVTFDEVADHLAEYAQRHPDHEHVVEAVASFLANVEDVPHRHGQAGPDEMPLT